MKNNSLFFFILSCGLLVSCMKWGSSENSRLMQQAQQLIEQMPDSALTLLYAMNTVGLSEAERAEYNLLQIQARRNSGMDLSSETEIFNVREYFIHKNDPQKAALACFYAAFVATEQNKAITGMDYYQEALDFAKETDNKELQGKILYNMGYLNYDGGWYDDAIIRYQQAFEIFQKIDHQYHLEVKSLNSIANSLMMKTQTDSAQYYYQKALDQARLHEDSALQVMVYNNMGVAYREHEQFDKAIFFSRQALQLAINDDDKILIYLNLADVFYEIKGIDSARCYIQFADTLLHSIDNIYTTITFANFSYQIEKTAENFQKALEHFELRSKLVIEVLEDNDRKLLLEMQRKYDITSKENELNKQRNRAWEITGVTLAIALALAVSFIIILRNNMKKKEELAKEQIKNSENQLALEQAEREKMEKAIELENVLKQAQTLQDMYNQRDSEMKTKFLEKIGIIKKVALLFPLLDEDKLKEKNEQLKLVRKTRDVVKNLDLQKFTDIANELHPDFTVRLKQMYSTLDEREISICCLLLFDFSNQELDLFINRRMKNSLYTIQTWKTTIRRKLNIDSYGDIKTHLLGKIAK